MLQTETNVLTLDINLIIPNKYQPRKVFDEKALTSLSESIKTYGIINPILVRKKDDKYEIIAGERRFRAAKQIGLSEVPVIVKNANEQEMAELALIENLERQGLSPIEEAKSYEEIMKIGNHTQEQLAKKLGKSQPSIANKIRLLSLPIEIQEALSKKQISERHARSLISVTPKEKQLEILNRIIKEKLTVKETENIINAKQISEEEIKKAISDIMKSIDTIDEDKKEEKDDDNMNNGNFFPSFDNAAMPNNNTSLNMMNMQSMNQAPMAPAPEVVMPTVPQSPITIEPQIEMPQLTPMMESPVLNEQPSFGPSMMPEPELVAPAPQMEIPQPMAVPAVDIPMMNEQPLFGPSMMPEPGLVAPAPQMEIPQPMADVPLFNPEANMYGPSISASETASSVEESTEDRLTELQNLLISNGYPFKTYSNATADCVIIEISKN